MKVICVSDSFGTKHNFDPKIGDELTVIDCEMVNGRPCYLFNEINSKIEFPLLNKSIEYWYRVENFSPLDTYKETEIERLKKELSL